MGSVIYELNELKKSYGEGGALTEVLKDISFQVEEGKMYCILGPSGSGKSTLLNLIGGLESCDGGSILYRGEDITKYDVKKMTIYRRTNLGFIFQFYNLISNLTVRENIEVCQNLSRDPMDIDHLIDILGLTEHQNKFPRHLSGGQQQRVAIARALAKKPSVLLCDEPTGALDYKMSMEILKLMEHIRSEFGMTLLVVTHNEAITGMSDWIVRIRDGRNVETYQNEHVRAASELSW